MVLLLYTTCYYLIPLEAVKESDIFGASVDEYATLVTDSGAFHVADVLHGFPKRGHLDLRVLVVKHNARMH